MVPVAGLPPFSLWEEPDVHCELAGDVGYHRSVFPHYPGFEGGPEGCEIAFHFVTSGGSFRERSWTLAESAISLSASPTEPVFPKSKIRLASVPVMPGSKRSAVLR